MDDIQAFPSGVLHLTEEVSDLLSDIQTGSATLNASQIPLYMPRIEFLKKKLLRKRSDAQSMIDEIPADERFRKDSATVTAALKQQLVIINSDLNLLDEVKQSLNDSGNKLKEVKLL